MWRWLLAGISLLGVLVYAIPRDIQVGKGYAGDLRNRVTGARIVKDGGSPYFYKWKPADGVRYYDPENFNTAHGSNMSSPPMLYHLFGPLVDYPQSIISTTWLWIEYGMLIALTAFCVYRAPTTAGKQTVLLVMILVLLSNPWESHLSLGQTYLCIPFFAMLFLFFNEKTGHPAWAFPAGIAASCLVLIRFNTFLFFLPFLFLFFRYSKIRLFYLVLPALLFLCWIFADTHEHRLWQDYYRYVNRAFRTEQGLLIDNQSNTPDPRYPVWEGIDTMDYHRPLPVPIYSENGNAFIVYEAFLHRKMPLWMMTAGSLILISAFFLFFCRRTRPWDTPDVYRAALVGSCLFMIADIFSPVHRHQYYTIQWILPLMLAAGQINRRQKLFYALLLTGLLLNCVHLPFLRMQNTIGEYLILLVLLLIAADSAPTANANPLPAQVSSPREFRMPRPD